jgi:cobalamin biosynthesis protein CobD/CbiB
MILWPTIAIGAYVALIILRAMAIRRLRSGEGGLAPFLIGPTILLLVLPVASILAFAPKLGWLSLLLAGFLTLNAFLLIRPLMRAVNAARRGDLAGAFDAYSNDIGEGMVASMALTVGGGVVLLIVFLICTIINR